MAEERNMYQGPEFSECHEHYDNKSSDAAVDYIHQLLQSGQSFIGEKAEELDIFHQQMLDPLAQPTVTALTAVASSSSHIKEPTLPVPSTPTATAPAVSEAPQPPQAQTKAKKSKALKHKCDTCCQVFDSRIALSIHSGRIHKSDGRDKNYQCPYCTKSFFNSSYLSQHMRIHTGIKPYECTMCHKTFKQLSHLQQHERTHSGEKPYRCKEPGCTKAFSQLSNLQSHTRSHLPDGNVHKCTSCYKCYYDEASLNSHLRTHMVNKRVRNYICEECGKSYTQDTYLQNHIKNKHAGVTGATGDKLAYPARPAAVQQPTSIQAATSMICKVEDQGPACPTTSLGSSLQSPLLRQHEVMSKLMAPNPTVAQGGAGPPLPNSSVSAQSGYSSPEGSYHRLAGQHLFSSPSRRQYDDHCSAFKPLPRLGLHGTQAGLQGMESMPADLARQRSSSSSGHGSSSSAYDLLTNNVLPLAHSHDTKVTESMDRRHEEMDRYWKLRSNIAAAVYPSLNSQIQSYMVGGGYGGSYGSTYSPHDSAYHPDKACLYQHDKSNMFDSDSTNDYYIGGLREAYNLD